MEIKIQCNCGARYKFEIEPVHSRMPTPVKCPECGADGTFQANQQIQQALTGAPPPPPVAAVSSAAPEVSASPPPPPPPPPLSPGGLRITRPTAPPAVFPVAGGAGQVPPPPPIVPVYHAAAGSEKKQSTLAKVLITVAIILCFCGGGVAYLGYKVVPKIQKLAKDVDEATDSGNTDVADLCKTYWREKLNKTLTISPLTNAIIEDDEFELIPPHNGYVRIAGGLNWPAPQFEGLAQYLSEKLNTLVFEVRDEEVSSHFGAYEQGTRKFHALMETKIKGRGDAVDVNPSVVTEGKEWALANGYRAGEGGFEEFELSDGDKMTQYRGMKMWDEREGEEIAGYIMKPSPLR
jgi:hypothetical protein